MMKVNKQTLNELIQERREYYNTTSWSEKDDHNEKVRDLSKELCEQTGVDWISWLNLIWALMDRGGFMYNTTNDDIYRFLNAIGVEIVDEDGNSD